VGRYTSTGAGDASTKFIQEEMPDPLTDFTIGAYIMGSRCWHKLHTAKKQQLRAVSNSGRRKTLF
jgi:hypothetical protein